MRCDLLAHHAEETFCGLLESAPDAMGVGMEFHGSHAIAIALRYRAEPNRREGESNERSRAFSLRSARRGADALRRKGIVLATRSPAPFDVPADESVPCEQILAYTEVSKSR